MNLEEKNKMRQQIAELIQPFVDIGLISQKWVDRNIWQIERNES